MTDLVRIELIFVLYPFDHEHDIRIGIWAIAEQPNRPKCIP